MSKVFVVVIDEVYDYEQGYHKPIVFADREKASKYLKNTYEQVLKEFEDTAYDMHEFAEDGSNGEIWVDGSYTTDHWCITLYETEIVE